MLDPNSCSLVKHQVYRRKGLERKVVRKIIYVLVYSTRILQMCSVYKRSLKVYFVFIYNNSYASNLSNFHLLTLKIKIPFPTPKPS